MDREAEDFREFCAAHAFAQTHSGLEVPSSATHSFAYYQWREVAKQKYQQMIAAEKRPQTPLKRMKFEDDASREGRGAGSAEPSDCLAEALAWQLLASLEKQTDLTSAPASLRHAAQEGFPMPPRQVELPAYLSLAENAMRLTLWYPDDARLAKLAAQMRPQLRVFEESGVLKPLNGRFPVVQLLMDLLSWRIIIHRWERLTPELRQVALTGGAAVCNGLKSPASAELRAAMTALDATSATLAVPVGHLDRLVARMSAAIPFQFPVCRDLAGLYPEPQGQLLMAETEESPQAKAAKAAETQPKQAPVEPGGGSAADPDDVCLGELLQSATPAVETAAGAAGAGRSSPPPHSTDEGERAVPATPPSATATPRRSDRRSKENRARPCASRYHQRYASAELHASQCCPYCSTCHLMEIVFGGDTRRCTWGHWPNTKKLTIRLKSFPAVLKLALERLAKLERGVTLKPINEVPLGP